MKTGQKNDEFLTALHTTSDIYVTQLNQDFPYMLSPKAKKFSVY